MLTSSIHGNGKRACYRADDFICAFCLLAVSCASCSLLSCLVLSCLVVSCPVLLCPVLYCPVVRDQKDQSYSYRNPCNTCLLAISCPFVHFAYLQFPVLLVLSCPDLSCPVLSSLVLSLRTKKIKLILTKTSVGGSIV